MISRSGFRKSLPSGYLDLGKHSLLTLEPQQPRPPKHLTRIPVPRSRVFRCLTSRRIFLLPVRTQLSFDGRHRQSQADIFGCP